RPPPAPLSFPTRRSSDLHDPRWSLPLSPAELEQAVEGREIERLGRRGKYLVWELAGDAFLLLHLRMTGTLLLRPPERTAHTRVRSEEHTSELQSLRHLVC